MKTTNYFSLPQSFPSQSSSKGNLTRNSFAFHVRIPIATCFLSVVENARLKRSHSSVFSAKTLRLPFLFSFYKKKKGCQHWVPIFSSVCNTVLKKLHILSQIWYEELDAFVFLLLFYIKSTKSGYCVTSVLVSLQKGQNYM